MALEDASVRQSHVVLIKKETCAPCWCWANAGRVCAGRVCAGRAVHACSGAGRVGVGVGVWIAVLWSKVGITRRSRAEYRTQAGVVPRCKIVVTWWMGLHTTSTERGCGGRLGARCAASVWLGARAREWEGRCAHRVRNGLAGAKRTFRCSRGGHWLRKRPRGSPGGWEAAGQGHDGTATRQARLANTRNFLDDATQSLSPVGETVNNC